jgi:hypothetical protein
VRRSPHLGTHAAAITAVALVLAAGAAARTGGGTTDTLRVTTNGVVTVTPGQRVCARTCAFRFRRGAVVTLRATPPPNFVFRGWTGGCVGEAPTCVVAVDRTTSVRAAFVGEPEAFELTVSGPGTVVSRPAGIDCGAGHGDCGARFPWGTSVELTAAPGASGRFVRWGDACSSVGDGPCTLGAQGFTRVLATFASAAPASGPQRLTVALAGRQDVRLVSMPAGIDCPTTCEALFASGTVVVLTPQGFGAAWSGSCQSGDASACSVIVDERVDVVVRATAGPAPPPPAYGVSVTVAGEGTVTAPGIKCGGRSGTLFDCEHLFGSHAKVVLTARPAKSARFAGWNQFCTGKKPRCTLSIAAPMTVGAVFRR